MVINYKFKLMRKTMNRQEALELMYIDEEAFNLINLTNC